MDSNHQAWTEVWGAGGVAADIYGLTFLDTDMRAKLVAAYAYAACNSYTTGTMDLLLLQALETLILAKTTEAD